MGCTVSHQTFYSTNAYNGCRYYATIENDPENEKECVVKVFQDKIADQLSDMKEDVDVSSFAKDFADEFQRSCSPTLKFFGLQFEIDFVQTFVAKMKQLAGVKTCGLCLQEVDEELPCYFKLNHYVFIAPYISGKYEKFSNNVGWEREYDQIVTAFTHWTWQISGGK